jgi:hypothetical protein
MSSRWQMTSVHAAATQCTAAKAAQTLKPLYFFNAALDWFDVGLCCCDKHKGLADVFDIYLGKTNKSQNYCKKTAL